MLFNASSSVLANLSTVSQDLFDGTWGYLILIVGLILAFYIIETLIDLIQKPEDIKIDKIIEENESLRAETERLLDE
jgi:hypothetical protein